MKRDIKQLKEEMTAAGFRAAPFAYIVWTIRRMLWPFLRQYHFLQLEKLVETEEFITQGLEKLTVAHVQLRSDVAALTNRQGQMAIDLENSGGAPKLFLTNTDAGVFVLKSGDLISEFAALQGCWDSHLMPVLEKSRARDKVRRWTLARILVCSPPPWPSTSDG